MTKQQMVARISKQTGIDPASSLVIVETFFAIVKAQVSQGETIYLRKFGRFGPKQRGRKLARLIKENTTLVIDAHTIPWFKPSPEFSERVKTSNPLLQEALK